MKELEYYPCPECGTPKQEGLKCLLCKHRTSLERKPKGFLYAMNNRGVPERYINVEKKEYPHSDLLLSGSVGSGKTYQAIQYMKQHYWDSYNKSSYFIPFSLLLYQIKKGFDLKQYDEDGKGILEKIWEKDFLIIDDLGAERLTEWSFSEFYLLLDQRINRCKQTIITTNLNMEEIHQTFGPRVTSRLSGFQRIEFKVDDKRMK